MKEFSYTIKEPMGIHARPAGLLLKKLREFSSAVTIIRGIDRCEGNNLLALMKMRIKAGETITLRFEGLDEYAAAIVAETYVKEFL